MKKPWRDPVKDVPAKSKTLATEGDFEKFTELMKRIVKVRPPREAKGASPGPAASS